MESKATHEDTNMEICEADEEMWGGEEYDPPEAERFKRYRQIDETIKYIRSQEFRLTEDWSEAQKMRIMMYRDWFPNYNLVDPEVEHETFRRKCQETETLIAHLSDCVMRKTTFSVKFYLILLEHMKWLIDHEEAADKKVSKKLKELGMDDLAQRLEKDGRIRLNLHDRNIVETVEKQLPPDSEEDELSKQLSGMRM